MSGLSINVSWEYFLGIMAALVAVAFYSNGRFTKIETSIEWIKEIIGKLDTRLSSIEGKYSESLITKSPISLTEKGENILTDSGLKKYIDDNGENIISSCKSGWPTTTPYDVQESVFNMFDKYEFPAETLNSMKTAAFNHGVSEQLVRRIGSIYFRDKLLAHLGMKPEDLDYS